MNIDIGIFDSIFGLLAAVFSWLGTFHRTRQLPRWESVSMMIVVPLLTLLLVFYLIGSTSKSPVNETPIINIYLPKTQSDSTEPPEETAPQMVRETKERNFSFSRRNNHCSGSHNVRWHVKATPGWEIDIHSIEDEVTVKSSRSNYDGVVDMTKDGFFITGRVINSGDCIRAFGKTIAKDGRGSLHVKGTYIETRMVPEKS